MMRRRGFLRLLGGLFSWRVAGASAAADAEAWAEHLSVSFERFAGERKDSWNETVSHTASSHATYGFKTLQQHSTKTLPVSSLFQPYDDTRFVKLTTLKVAGLQYGELSTHPFLPGEYLRLVREPHNAYDPYAVAIRYAGMRVGYIPRTNSRIVASLIDAGIPLYAAVRYFEVDKEPWERLWVGVWMERV